MFLVPCLGSVLNNLYIKHLFQEEIRPILSWVLFQPSGMVLWQQTALFIQQNMLLCHLAILFIGQRFQRSQRLDKTRPLSEFVDKFIY
jgi:hypothetical protein